MTEKKGCSTGAGKGGKPCGGQGEESCGCGCSGGGLQLELYWCETCRREVADKRCPLCGQKTKRGRPGG